MRHSVCDRLGRKMKILMLKFLHAPNTTDTFHRYTYIWKVGREFKVALKFSSVLHLISSKA